MVFVLLCLLFLSQILSPEKVAAGVHDNAYTFYSTYENEMSFLEGTNKQGEIYYATKAKKNEKTGTKYTTIGWKVRVFDSQGGLVETLYYQLGGAHMRSIDVRAVDGYEYCLYKVTLADIKERMSQEGLRALENPNCNIIFDACTTTKLDGVVQGGMTDAGPSWGKVYTTYNGIVNAKNWSEATKETLKSYYNKTVQGLFYDVKVEKGVGISRVRGEGRYCFGTQITLSAELEEGYHFAGWSGDYSSNQESFVFTVEARDIHMKAVAQENGYYILYDVEKGSVNVPMQYLRYGETLTFPSSGAELDGSTLFGWQTDGENGAVWYEKGRSIALKEIIKKMNLQRVNDAVITFYAVWDRGPMILTENIYVSLRAAQQGRITEEWLVQRVEAVDPEEGELLYGKHENSFFFIEGFEAGNYTALKNECIKEEIFSAADSAGNITRKVIQVHVIDTSMYAAKDFRGKVRFISEKYYKDVEGNLIDAEKGGLSEDSVWRMDKEYQALLDKLFK